ncbi:hypothetical protein ACU686_09605 [Yinghuangia aomiensis]
MCRRLWGWSCRRCCCVRCSYRTRPSLREHRRTVACAAVAGFVAAAAVFVWYRANRTEVVWAARHDPPQAPHAVGAWTTEDQVVRVRPDLVTAYRITDGRVAWTWAPPGRDTVCAMSGATTGGIGLIAHEAADGGCTTVAALDLASGSVRWTRHTDPRYIAAG